MGELRSYLHIKGKLFFSEQELPICWLLIVTAWVLAYLGYRVFFISGVSLQSILFNGMLYLSIMLVALMMRISSTSFKFQSLQKMQEKLIGKQRLSIKCRKRRNDDDAHSDVDILNDLLFIIQMEDIYPRLFHFKLSAVLCLSAALFAI